MLCVHLCAAASCVRVCVCACNENRTLARAWQTPSQSVPLFREREQGGRINPDISNHRRRNRLEREKQKNKTRTVAPCDFQAPSVVVEHMADVFDGPYHECVHMRNMCARGGTPALTPGGVHTIRASENDTFLLHDFFPS